MLQVKHSDEEGPEHERQELEQIRQEFANWKVEDGQVHRLSDRDAVETQEVHKEEDVQEVHKGLH